MSAFGAILAASCVGCGADEAAPSTVPELTVPELAKEAIAPSSYPIDTELLYGRSWVADRPSQATLYRKWQGQIVECMAKQGFVYEPGEPGLGDELSLTNPLNEQVAQAVGYHLDTLYAQDDSASDANQRQSDAFWAALQDKEVEHGCGPESWDQTIGRVQPYLDAMEPLLTEAGEAIAVYNSTAEAVDRQRAWADCMKARGYQYESPADPIAEFVDHSTVTDQEINVRLADIECDRSTRLTQTKSEGQTAIIERWEDDQASALAEVRELLKAHNQVVAQ